MSIIEKRIIVSGIAYFSILVAILLYEGYDIFSFTIFFSITTVWLAFFLLCKFTLPYSILIGALSNDLKKISKLMKIPDSSANNSILIFWSIFAFLLIILYLFGLIIAYKGLPFFIFLHVVIVSSLFNFYCIWGRCIYNYRYHFRYMYAFPKTINKSYIKNAFNNQDIGVLLNFMMHHFCCNKFKNGLRWFFVLNILCKAKNFESVQSFFYSAEEVRDVFFVGSQEYKEASNGVDIDMIILWKYIYAYLDHNDNFDQCKNECKINGINVDILKLTESGAILRNPAESGESGAGNPGNLVEIGAIQ